MWKFFRILLPFISIIAGASQLKAQVRANNSTDTTSGIIDTTNNLIIIGDVKVTGFKKTKPYIIQREIPFTKGEYMLRNDLEKKLVLCRQRLMNTSLFVDVEVNANWLQKDAVLITVHIKERWYLFPLPYFKLIDRNLNTWWVDHKRSLQRVNYGLKFMQNNVSGRNDNLNIWLISGYTQQASFRYENPFLDKNLKHGMNIGFAFSRNREVNYATDLNKQLFTKHPDETFLIQQLHIDLAYSYRPAIKTRHNFRVSYSNFQVDSFIVNKNPNYFPNNKTSVRFPDFSYSIEYYNADFNPYPLKGFTGDAHFYKRFGPDNDIGQIGAKGTYSMHLFNKSYLQFQGSAKLSFPFNQPYFNTRLFGSSDLYMRGLEYYVIDGVAGGIARVTAKNEVLNFHVMNPIGTKTHDKIPFRVFVKAYADAGYAYNPKPGNSLLNNRWLTTYGAGVDIVSFYDFVLKLEYSFNPISNSPAGKFSDFSKYYKPSGFYIHTKSDF